MSNVVSTPYPRPPQLLDVFADEYWANTYGPLQAILKNSEGDLSAYPLSWLGEEDTEFKSIQKKISSGGTPSYIFPIGKLIVKDGKFILEMSKYRY